MRYFHCYWLVASFQCWIPTDHPWLQHHLGLFQLQSSRRSSSNCTKRLRTRRSIWCKSFSSDCIFVCWLFRFAQSSLKFLCLNDLHDWHNRSSSNVLFTEYPLTGLANSIHDRAWLTRVSAAAMRSLILSLSGRWFVRLTASQPSCFMPHAREGGGALCRCVCTFLLGKRACLLSVLEFGLR